MLRLSLLLPISLLILLLLLFFLLTSFCYYCCCFIASLVDDVIVINTVFPSFFLELIHRTLRQYRLRADNNTLTKANDTVPRGLKLIITDNCSFSSSFVTEQPMQVSSNIIVSSKISLYVRCIH